jgi:penicillin amidase
VILRRLAFWGARGLAAVFLLAVSAAVVLVVWLRTSVPTYAGRQAAPGLSQAMTITRDRYGVPTISAASKRDAYFGLGFVHAQDRLWQMEISRRLSEGRLAETVGLGGLETDELVRALDLDAAGAATERGLSAEARRDVEAYVAGVNAELSVRRGALPIEFVALGIKPRAWSVADVARMAGLVTLGFGDWRDELLRLKLHATLSCDQIYALFPTNADPRAVTYPDAHLAPAASDQATCGLVDPPRVARLANSRGGLPAQIGRTAPASNSWAVDGRRSSTGAAQLANDPHGPFGAPADYYLVRMQAPGFQLTGASRPGSPGLAAGTNGKIAWGVTDMMADLADVFVEQVDPADPDRYFAPGGPQPFERRQARIAVKGGPAVVFRWRTSRHGPVISDFVSDAKGVFGSGRVAALAGVAPRANPLVNAMTGFAEARDWGQFQAAAADFRFQQNFSFAGPDGDIGMVSSAVLPSRRTGDGFMPVPGWSGVYDWLGMKPGAALPFVHRPASGFVVNANNVLVIDGPPELTGRNHVPPFRARRIVEVLSLPGLVTPGDMTRLQLDQRSLQAADLLPRLLRLKARDAAGRSALDLLSRWDGTMDQARSQPLIYAAWLEAVTHRLLAPRLGPLLDAYLGSDRIVPVAELLDDTGPWCAASRPPAKTSCEALSQAAFDEAIARLVKANGPEISRWRWGAVHQAGFPNQLLSSLPIVKDRVALSAPVGGDNATVNAGHMALTGRRPFAAYYGPRYRQVIDLAAPNASRFMIAPGVSGDPFAPSYGALVKPWAAGQYIVFGAEPAAKTLTLVPSGGGRRPGPSRRE